MKLVLFDLPNTLDRDRCVKKRRFFAFIEQSVLKSHKNPEIPIALRRRTCFRSIVLQEAHVYDPAGIDYAQWHKWKAKDVYIISREKANSMAEVIGLNDYDRHDPRNTGILSDELVGVFAQVMMRRVRYRDPATGSIYSFMTNEMTLPPGLIAFLYKLRWDIEKIFDEKKNKLGEKKSCAKGALAHCQQAHFVCLAHNLMVLFERCLEKDEGIRDTKVERKREKRAELEAALAKERGEILDPLVKECRRSTQRSLQFIRWLRHCLWHPTSWSEEVAVLRPLMEDYLQ